MARINNVFLYGQLAREPRVIVDTNGVNSKASLSLKVIGRYSNEKKEVIASCPCVITSNPELIKTVISLNKGDMCFVKGVYSTLNISKTAICKCGHKNTKPGMVSFVAPIFLKPMERLSNTCQNEDDYVIEGGRLLTTNKEISNTVYIIGTVCQPPKFYRDETNPNIRCCTFNLAVDKSYNFKNGETSLTDYIWVRCYGEQAEEISRVLQVNSTVYVCGAINVKQVNRMVTCEKCGELIKYTDYVYEVRPYSIEYLHNCNLPGNKTYLNNYDLKQVPSEE